MAVILDDETHSPITDQYLHHLSLPLIRTTFPKRKEPMSISMIPSVTHPVEAILDLLQYTQSTCEFFKKYYLNTIFQYSTFNYTSTILGISVIYDESYSEYVLKSHFLSKKIIVLYKVFLIWHLSGICALIK